jgi:hypothetical protein
VNNEDWVTGPPEGGGKGEAVFAANAGNAVPEPEGYPVLPEDVYPDGGDADGYPVLPEDIEESFSGNPAGAVILPDRAAYERMERGVADGLKESFRAEFESVKALAESLSVTDDASLSAATALSHRIDGLVKALEARRKEIVEPPKRFAKAVDRAAKFFTEPLGGLLKSLKSKMTEYGARLRREAELKAAAERAAKAERLRKEREEWERLERERLAAEPEAVPEPVPAFLEVVPDVPDAPSKTMRTEGGKAQLFERWKYRLVDIGVVPRQYLEVDDRKVKAAITGGARSIPGLEIYAEMDTRLLR